MPNLCSCTEPYHVEQTHGVEPWEEEGKFSQLMVGYVVTIHLTAQLIIGQTGPNILIWTFYL